MVMGKNFIYFAIFYIKHQNSIYKILQFTYSSDNENEDEGTQTKEATDSKPEAANAANSSENGVQDESKKAKRRRKRKAQNSQVAANEESKSETVDAKTSSCDTEETPAKKSKIELTSTVEETPINPELSKKKKNKKKNNSNNHDASKPMESKETVNKKPDIKKKQNPFTANTIQKSTNNANKNTFNKNNAVFQTPNGPNKSKPASKNNPFAKDNTNTNGSLPPLRKNLPKSKPMNGKFKGSDKFKSKFSHKRPFGKSHGKGDGKDISDERLKAYGINPRKFHKKQKYGGNKPQ